MLILDQENPTYILNEKHEVLFQCKDAETAELFLELVHEIHCVKFELVVDGKIEGEKAQEYLRSAKNLLTRLGELDRTTDVHEEKRVTQL